MDNFNFNLFKYFYYVVIYNGYTNASKNLSVAQPSLSLSIKNLETQLNKNLIDRTKKHFCLTDDGYNLFQVLKPIFESIENNIEFGTNEKKYLDFNIGIRYNYGKILLSDVLKRFKNDYPRVRVTIDLYSKLDLTKTKTNEYDIVIDDKDYIEQLENVNMLELCTLDNYIVCGKDVYERYKNINEIKELDLESFISYRPSLKTGKFKEFCYKNNINFLEIICVNESDLYFKLIKDNIGLGISNQLLLKRYFNNKTIYKIDLKESLFKDTLSVAYTKNNKMINDFIDILKNYINEELR